MKRSLPSIPFLLWFGVLCLLASAPALAQDKTLTARPIADAPSFAKRALVIGIGQYEHAGSLAPTTYNDARRFADLLKTQFKFPDEAVTLLTDAPNTPESQRPTYIHLRNAYKTLLAGINDKSEVVIYFSGHGTRAGDHDWLVPLDGLPSDVVGTCIDYDEFKSQLATRLPARALLIVDACRNLSGGKDAGSSGFGAGKSLTGPQFAEMLSCRPKEESKVGKPEDFTESVFTHFLLQGLKGDPEALDGGVVTFDSLNEYVQGRVSQYVSRTYGEAQNPDGRASLGKMVLAKGTKATAAPHPDPARDAITLARNLRVGDTIDYELDLSANDNGAALLFHYDYSNTVKEVRPNGEAILENSNFSVVMTEDGKQRGDRRALSGSMIETLNARNLLQETRIEGAKTDLEKQGLQMLIVMPFIHVILPDRPVKTADVWEAKCKDFVLGTGELVPCKVTFLGFSRIDDRDTWAFKQTALLRSDTGKDEPFEFTIWQSVTTGRTVRAEFTIPTVPSGKDGSRMDLHFLLRQR